MFRVSEGVFVRAVSGRLLLRAALGPKKQFTRFQCMSNV